MRLFVDFRVIHSHWIKKKMFGKHLPTTYRFWSPIKPKFYRAVRNCAGYPASRNVKDSYYILQVTEDNTDAEIKEAYENLVEECRTDNKTATNDPKKFSQIEEAYQIIQEHRKLDEDDLTDAAKLIKDTETLLERQMRNVTPLYESAVMERHKGMSRKLSQGNAVNRLVEYHVKDAISRGELKDLPGAGKPLKTDQDHNPLIDKTTHLLNKVLIDNGFAPEWVMIAKQIRARIVLARDTFLLERTRAGADLDKLDAKMSARWTDAQKHFRQEVGQINDKVHDLNLIAPTLRQQMFPYNQDREIKKVLKLYTDLAESGNLPNIILEEQSFNKNNPGNHSEISAKTIWKDISSFFSLK